MRDVRPGIAAVQAMQLSICGRTGAAHIAARTLKSDELIR